MEEAPDRQDVSSSSTGESPAAALLKGKRTKRHRALPAAASLSASSADATTEEEEDMAHCLILLAQGRALDSPAKFTSRRFAEAATTAGGKAGFYVYECKTCNKCFPSFQALGGHRASHKKPRLAAAAAAPADHGQETADDVSNVLPMWQPAATSPKQLRIHECSICGAEFSSGQALGGHMRRHRPIGAQPPAAQPQNNHHIVKKERNVLSLDLNLPAPSDEEPHKPPPPPPPPPVAFQFADKRPMVFSPTSALVDCHI